MNKHGFLFVLAGAVLWGTTGTAQALAPESAQSLAIGALRLVVGGAALLAVFARSQRRAAPLNAAGTVTPRHGLPLAPLILAAGCMAAYQVLFFAGVRLTGVAVGTIVGIGSSPVLAGLLGLLFRGERPGWRWAIATFMAVAGCALLAAAGKDIQIDLLGMLLAVGAGAAYAVFSLLSKDLLDHFPVEQVMAAVFGLGAVLLAPFLFTQDLSWLAAPRGVAAVLHLGLFATALAYLLFGKGLRLVPLATAVTFSLAEPLTAGALGVLLLGERLSLQAGLGIFLIFGGLVVLSLPGRWFSVTVLR